MTARPHELLTSAEVAQRFRFSLDWFYRNRRRLEENGFPAPLRSHPNRWHPGAIEDWFARSQHQQGAASGMEVPVPAGSTIAAWRRTLGARAAALAAGAAPEF